MANVSLPGPMTTIIEAAMPEIKDGDPPPHVLDFVLFQTAAGDEMGFAQSRRRGHIDTSAECGM